MTLVPPADRTVNPSETAVEIIKSVRVQPPSRTNPNDLNLLRCRMIASQTAVSAVTVKELN
ncbi:hypothetical protein [Mycobacterium camsae]|uniref:hypothetical protein n=1 Tax=Mycobacterium gordonae TaxID=1778 RepID=UPI0019818D3C|nr:hypothetical protein [Mycobacterium gordonae]